MASALEFKISNTGWSVVEDVNEKAAELNVIPEAVPDMYCVSSIHAIFFPVAISISPSIFKSALQVMFPVTSTPAATSKLPATVVVDPAALAPPVIVNTVSTPPLSVQATPKVRVPFSLSFVTSDAVTLSSPKVWFAAVPWLSFALKTNVPQTSLLLPAELPFALFNFNVEPVASALEFKISIIGLLLVEEVNKCCGEVNVIPPAEAFKEIASLLFP